MTFEDGARHISGRPTGVSMDRPRPSTITPHDLDQPLSDTAISHAHSQQSSHSPDDNAQRADGRPLDHQQGPAKPQSALIRDNSNGSHERDIQSPRHTCQHNSPSSPARTSCHQAPRPGKLSGLARESDHSIRLGEVPTSVVEQTSPSRAAANGIVSHDRASPPSVSTSFVQQHDAALNAVSLASSQEDPGPSTRQTVRSLLHIATLASPLSLALCLYTIAGLLLSLLLAPLRICFKPLPTLNDRLLHVLVPALNLQRRCIYAAQLAPASSRASRASASSRTPLSSSECVRHTALPYTSTTSALPIVSTLLIAPVIALPLAACAWIMGTAWGLGAMVSDEEAGDDKDERHFAERVVNWWCWWLDRGVPEGDLEALGQRPSPGRRKPEMMLRRDVVA